MHKGVHTKVELREYHCKFLHIVGFLHAKSKISDIKRNKTYLKGFNKKLRICILNRFAITKSNTCADDGYDYLNSHKATEFLLSGPVPSTPSVVGLSAPAAPTKVESMELIKMCNIMCSLQQQISSLTNQGSHVPWGAPAAAAPPPAAPQSGYTGYPLQASQEDCMFCGKPGEHIRDSAVAAEYVHIGKAVQDPTTGRSVPPGGAVLPFVTEGNLKEQFNLFHTWNPANLAPTAANTALTGGAPASTNVQYCDPPPHMAMIYKVSAPPMSALQQDLMHTHTTVLPEYRS